MIRVETFAGPVARAAACFGDRDALVDATTGATVSFSELAQHTAAIGNLLSHAGAELGDRVAVLADGSSRYAELYLGVPAAGRVIVPLNGRYTETELAAACHDCDPRLLFTDRDPDSCSGLVEQVLPMDAFDSSPSELIDPVARRVREDDGAAIFYTGGTTDRAKGVLLSHRNKLVDALSLIAGLGITESDRWLVMSPMFHAAGSFNVLPCVWVGATQVFLPRFDAHAALAAIEQYGITITFGVPTMLQALADAQEQMGADVSSLRLLGHGGAPITAALLERTAALFPDTELCGMYGATEMAPLATIYRHQERVLGQPIARSAGIPVLGVDVRVVDTEGADAPVGEIGEILVSGPNVMLGYWGKPEETSLVLDDHTYRSGDLGFRDEHGRLYVVDRTKDMIITGGENVYGVEVENALAAHPAVVESAVLGRTDERWGELVVAVIVTRAPVTREELDRHCRATLAAYKVPRVYEFRTEPLPRSAAGKLLKRELRDATSGTSHNEETP